MEKPISPCGPNRVSCGFRIVKGGVLAFRAAGKTLERPKHTLSPITKHLQPSKDLSGELVHFKGVGDNREGGRRRLRDLCLDLNTQRADEDQRDQVYEHLIWRTGSNTPGLGDETSNTLFAHFYLKL